MSQEKGCGHLRSSTRIELSYPGFLQSGPKWLFEICSPTSIPTRITQLHKYRQGNQKAESRNKNHSLRCLMPKGENQVQIARSHIKSQAQLLQSFIILALGKWRNVYPWCSLDRQCSQLMNSRFSEKSKSKGKDRWQMVEKEMEPKFPLHADCTHPHKQLTQRGGERETVGEPLGVMQLCIAMLTNSQDPHPCTSGCFDCGRSWYALEIAHMLEVCGCQPNLAIWWNQNESEEQLHASCRDGNGDA